MVLQQNPHQTNKTVSSQLEIAIGRKVHAIRKQQHLTVADLSKLADISIGMLSKIENGQTSPSLKTLQALSSSLSVPLTSFFQGYEEFRPAIHVKAGQGVVKERVGTRAGHQYNLLGHIGANSSGMIMEPYLIKLTEKSDSFDIFQHDGMEILYMLEGEVEYRHGETLYTLLPGDSLFFDADSPHGPVNLVKLPAIYLSIIAYPQN